MILNSSDVAAIHPSSLSFADVLMDPLIAAGILLTGIGIGLGSSGVSKNKEVAPVTCHCECSGQSPSSPEPTGYSLRELTFVGVIGILLGFGIILSLGYYHWNYSSGSTGASYLPKGGGKGKKGVFGAASALTLTDQ